MERNKSGRNNYKKELLAREQEIEILKQIIEITTYNLNLKQVLEGIVEIVSEYFEADSCFIYLAEGKELVLEASKNPRKAALGKIKMRMGEGITGWVAKNRESAVIDEKAYQDKRFKFFNILPEDKFEAFLSVPVIFKDKVVGVVNVQHVRKRAYDSNRVAFMEAVARLVGGVIENARLLSETNFLKEALETRKLIDRAKSILMTKGGLEESAAHKLLNKKSMDTRKSIKEIAEAIILSEEIMGKN